MFDCSGGTAQCVSFVFFDGEKLRREKTDRCIFGSLFVNVRVCPRTLPRLYDFPTAAFCIFLRSIVGIQQTVQHKGLRYPRISLSRLLRHIG